MATVSDAHSFVVNTRDLNQIGRDQHTHHHNHTHPEIPSQFTVLIDSSGPPAGLQHNQTSIQYHCPPVPCPCNPALHNSLRYALLLFEEKNGYPLWCPEPNSALPEEYRHEGIRIGDVGILQRDTPFDFLFNITEAADHPINRRGFPAGFAPLPLQELDETRHPYHRERDSDITGPKHSLSKNRIDGSLDPKFARSYEFTSSHRQGAILMLPEGSSLCKLESKAAFRTYAQRHARSWFEYAQERRGREFSSDTNPSLYLVTGWEKCPSWGIASFYNPDPDTVSLPFNVVKSIDGGYDRYDWGHHGRCETRCHPNARRLDGRGPRPTSNQCVFLLGFKVTLKRKNSKLKVEDITSNEFEAGKIFDAFGINTMPSGRSDSNNAISLAPESSSYNSQGVTGGYTRIVGSTSQTQGHEVQVLIDDSLAREEPSFHPCDLINDFMFEVSGAPPDSDLVAISHDDDWIALWDNVRDSFNPSAFLKSLASRFKLVFTPNEEMIYTEPHSELLEEHTLSFHSPSADGTISVVLEQETNWQAINYSDYRRMIRMRNSGFPDFSGINSEYESMVSTPPLPDSSGSGSGTKYITLLNNHFQKPGQDPTALSYTESVQYPSDKPVWTVLCKVNGVVKGKGVGGTKAAAKANAAQQACQAIVGE